MKKILLLLMVCMSFLSVTYAQIPTSNLISEYKFTNGRLDDTIGNNDLAQTGSALVFEDNRAAGPTKAATLNGDHLQITGFSSRVASMSFWIKTTTNDATYRVIFDQSERTTGADNSSQKGWYAYLKDGKVGVAGNYNYGYWGPSSTLSLYTGYSYTNATTNVSDGNWHHVVVTGEGSNGQYLQGGNQWIRYVRTVYKVYVDGVLESTNNIQVDLGAAIGIYMNFLGGGDPITIANSKFDNSTDRYQDSFDDFRVYNRVIDATEVGQLAAEIACSGTSGVTAVTQDITIELDASGNATIVAADIENGSSAVCDEPFTLSIDKDTFTCADLGFNIVTLTATETFATQAVSTATATVTVTYKPELVSQDITIQLDGSGNATITPADVNDASPVTGVCGDAITFSLDITTFSCAELGANVVTLTADDGNGNTNSITATVTVEDTVAPIAVGQNVALQVDPVLGYVDLTILMVENGSTDNCGTGSLLMTLSKSRFTCSETGDNTVTLTVEDLNGNIATTDVIVTVTSEVSDEIITSTNTNSCPDGTSGSTISTGGSIVGFNYTLRNSATNAIVDGPLAGTGNSLDFTTGNLSETTTFNVLAEKALAPSSSALNFDGTDDYVSLGTDNRGISSQVTVSAWIKTTASGATQFIASKYVYPLGYYLFIDTDGKAGIAGRNNSGAIMQSGISTTSVNDGEWHYITGNLNASTGVGSVYVDGVIENTITGSTGASVAGSADLLLGLTSALYFTGEIDMVTIWNIALDAAAVLSNMNSCLIGNETNIVGHFVFEDGSGTTLTDQSASALNGTLINMDGATDWMQIISPSCGEKICNYQLSTEVTIGDAIAPTAIAQDITAQIDANTGEVIITADMIDNGSTDNCTSVLIKSISVDTFDCEDVGDQIITLTIEDESGNTATAQATVTVISPIADETVTTASTEFCPDGSIATISIGSSVVGIDYYLRNSQTSAIKDGPIAGTGTGLDFSTGNISTTSTFNVYAKLAPTATPHSALDFDGVNDKVVTTYAPPATSTLTVELWMKPTKTSYSRVLSSYQGSSAVLAGEIIMDTYSPTNNGRALRFFVSGAGNVSHFAEVENALTLNTWNHVAATFDNGVIKLFVNGILVGVSTTAPFTSLPASSANVTIGEDRVEGPNAEYFQGQLDEVRIWNTAKTVSEIASSMNSCLTGTEPGLELFYDFNENTGLVTTDLVNGNNGTLTNMDSGSDWVNSDVNVTCGEVCDFQMTTEITIGDNTLPTVLVQDITVQLDASGNAVVSTTDINNNSTDNCTATGSLVLSLDKTAFTCADLGANTVTLTVEDTGGNQATATATVTVEDAALPTVTTQNIIVQLDATGNATIAASDVNNGSTDNCSSTITYAIDKTDFSCTDLGENIVTLTVTDVSGNESSADAIITVEDSVIPVAVSQNLTIELNESGYATLTAADINNNSTDNCTGNESLVLSIDKATFICSDIGANTVTLTVADINGNIATIASTVTVEDNITPTAIAKDVTVRLDVNNNATITAADVNNASTGNCSLALTVDINTFGLSNIGANTVTLTASDDNGNTSTATATVTILEYKQEQTITVDAVPDKVYGNSDITLVASASSGLAVTYAVISGPVTLSGNTANITGVGDVVIEVNQLGDSDFVDATEQITFSIAKADLQISADAQVITYGDAIPTLTITYSGFVNGETASVLDSDPNTTTAAVMGSESGSYDILMSGGIATNYNITLFDAILLIEKVTLTITADNKTITYGDAIPALTFAYSSFANGEDATVLTSEASVSTAAVLGSEAGSYDVVISAGTASNYDIVLENAILQIEKASLTITADDKSIVYGEAIPELTLTYDGFVNDETSTVLTALPSVSTDAHSESNAGDYIISISGTTTGNYEVTETNGAFVIEQATASIAITDLEYEEDGTAKSPTVTTNPADLVFTITYNGNSTAPITGGEYEVVVTIDEVNYIGTSTAIMIINAILGIEDETKLQISIYPNPVSDILIIDSESNINGKATLFNLKGEEVMNTKLLSNNTQLRISALHTGLYILVIQDEKSAIIKKQAVLVK